MRCKQEVENNCRPLKASNLYGKWSMSTCRLVTLSGGEVVAKI